MQSQVAFNPLSLMQALIASTQEQWLSPNYFEQIADKMGATNVTVKIELLTGMGRILRELPTEFFVSDDSRLTLLNNLQASLDQLIDQEEEE